MTFYEDVARAQGKRTTPHKWLGWLVAAFVLGLWWFVVWEGCLEAAR